MTINYEQQVEFETRERLNYFKECYPIRRNIRLLGKHE
jgi:hypothetical protein